MSEYNHVQYEVDAGIATITIDRPDVYNAFTRATILELNQLLRVVANDDSVYTLVVTGAGEGFCAGADTTAMPDWDDQTPAEYGAYLWLIQQVVSSLRGLSKPSIAAVNGPAIGAGCDFALACDLRVVGTESVLREGFVNIGLVPGDGGGWLLPRLVGEAKAKEYLLTGRDITPADAVDMGLAVTEADDALEEARDLAAEIAAKPAIAVRRTNDLIDPGTGFEEYCRLAAEYQWDCVTDTEHQEAVEAFNEGRDPEFDR